jgi:hypothetical protein
MEDKLKNVFSLVSEEKYVKFYKRRIRDLLERKFITQEEYENQLKFLDSNSVVRVIKYRKKSKPLQQQDNSKNSIGPVETTSQNSKETTTNPIENSSCIPIGRDASFVLSTNLSGNVASSVDGKMSEKQPEPVSSIVNTSLPTNPPPEYTVDPITGVRSFINQGSNKSSRSKSSTIRRIRICLILL